MPVPANLMTNNVVYDVCIMQAVVIYSTKHVKLLLGGFIGHTM